MPHEQVADLAHHLHCLAPRPRRHAAARGVRLPRPEPLPEPLPLRGPRAVDGARVLEEELVRGAVRARPVGEAAATLRDVGEVGDGAEAGVEAASPAVWGRSRPSVRARAAPTPRPRAGSAG
eukprot:SAG11_NODE_1856_length_4162_cov_4.778981_6_plen_122_part_00